MIEIDSCLAKLKRDSSHVELDLDPTLNSLRFSLRQELQLPEVNGNVQWFRFYESPQKDTSLIRTLTQYAPAGNIK